MTLFILGKHHTDLCDQCQFCCHAETIATQERQYMLMQLHKIGQVKENVKIMLDCGGSIDY